MRRNKYAVPAFASSVEQGMLLRDYSPPSPSKNWTVFLTTIYNIGRQAYELADTMITR